MGFHLRFIVMRCINTSRRSSAAFAAAGLLLGTSFAAAPAFADPKEVGVWYDDTGKGAVKIEICTPTTLCAKIYWLKEPMADNGKPKIDRFNPEPAMRNRPICGLPIMGDLVKVDSGFDNGWVYDPKEGKSYSVALDLVDQDTLKVTGYKGMRFLGKSFIWTRAPADLPSCDKDQASLPGAVPAPVPAVRKKQATAASATTKKAKNDVGASKLGAADVAKSSHKKKSEKATAATQQPPVASN
ncbi:DUF2147 domain-containing protein [Hyphomicrobium sp.]|uniref:DUF2147 domain-containing protein n=1 Tax=Hyphomicrobium sp. TaxID=82 RepID=UPI0025C4425A|nr:DUF2147 domain-containing protein [Hyphomicrobium sp.]